MRERSSQDAAWNRQKELSTHHNRLLADKVIYHGKFWERTITAARALRAVMKFSQRTQTLVPEDSYYSLKHGSTIKVERHPQEGGDFAV